MTGRRWAYAGGLLGGAVSIAANIAHSYVPPADAPADWSPHAGAVVGAVFWPVALFVAVEIFARIAWPAGRRWVVLRFGGLLPVALVAAIVSYRHLSGLLAFYGEDGLTVVIGPLAVDGLMVMATGALIATGRPKPEQAVRASVSAGLEVIPDRGPDCERGFAIPGLAEPGQAPEPAAEVPAVPTPVSTPTRTRTAPATKARTGTAAEGRTAKKTSTRTDAELIEALATVRRDADGTVPVRRAAAALGTGPDRARKLLAAEGLLRTDAGTPGTQDPAPVNGRQPQLTT